MKELPFWKHWNLQFCLPVRNAVLYLTLDLATVHSDDNYYYTGTKSTHNHVNSQLIKFHISVGT